MQNIDDLRLQIDTVDNEILRLLNDRMEFVKQIGILKHQEHTPIYRPERERDIISRLDSLSNGLLNKEAITAIYSEIFAVSRNIEMPQKIAYLGPIGTYTHQAARARFGSMSAYTPLSTIESVFLEIENKEAKYGVVPIENNTEGAVGITYDCLGKFENVKIVSEIYMDIHHSFVSMNDNLDDIKRIYSHPQGYNQCMKFLENHGLKDIEFIPTKSTAQAAKMVAGNKDCAAICSKIAAKVYNVPVLFNKIEDNSANKTRFFVLSDSGSMSATSSNYKTSILVTTKHRPGILAELLNMFKDENINLTKLESRPIKKKDFRSVFYIDFEGHIKDKNIQNILCNVKEHNIKWLGSYPNGDE